MFDPHSYSRKAIVDSHAKTFICMTCGKAEPEALLLSERSSHRGATDAHVMVGYWGVEAIALDGTSPHRAKFVRISPPLNLDELKHLGTYDRDLRFTISKEEYEKLLRRYWR